MLFNLNVFQASYFVPLLGSLVLERLLLALLELIVAHLLLSLKVLLRLQLLEELAVSDENTVWVSLLLSAPGLQFHSWIPPDWNFGIDSRVEWFLTSPLRSPLLAELVGSVAQHDSLIVANGCFWPIAARITASKIAARIVNFLLRHFVYKLLTSNSNYIVIISTYKPRMPPLPQTNSQSCRTRTPHRPCPRPTHTGSALSCPTHYSPPLSSARYTCTARLCSDLPAFPSPAD